jgi:hypothetical protein
MTEQYILISRILNNICQEAEVTRGWSKLHNGALHNLFSSANIIGLIKSRMMRWEGNAICINCNCKTRREETSGEAQT